MDNILESPKPVFGVRECLMLPAALCLGILWRNVFTLEGLSNLLFSSRPGPALGAAVFTAALWAFVLLFLGKRARWNRYSIGLAIGVGLLTVFCVLGGCGDVRAVNFILIFCGSVLAFFSLSGRSAAALESAACAGEAVGLFFRAAFTNWDKPFRALGGMKKGGSGCEALTGALLALPVLVVVTALLAGADQVFAGWFTGIADWFSAPDIATRLFRVLSTLFWSFCFFSCLYFAVHGPEPVTGIKKERQRGAPAAYMTALALLALVHIAFCAVQFAYLFGGAEAAAMQGGWAEYARRGFYQLVLVAAIDLGFVLFCSAKGGGTAAEKALSLLICALTLVILASAFWRMRLYIAAYGLSLLRVMTLWAMAFILLSLALASVKILRPGFKFWPCFAALGLYGWVLFNAAGVDARIADYNVDAYLDGRLPQVDIYYLANLSPSALPALERLNAAEPDAELELLMDGVTNRLHAPASWIEWSLPLAKYVG